MIFSINILIETFKNKNMVLFRPCFLFFKKLLKCGGKNMNTDSNNSELTSGQEFVLKNNKSIIKVVDKMTDGVVYFTDNSRTSIDSLNEKWESYKKETEDDMNINRIEQLQRGISIGEEDNSGIIRRIDVDDPRTKSIPAPVYQETPVLAKDANGNLLDLKAAGLHPDTIRQIEENKRLQLERQAANINDTGLNSLFGNDVVENYNNNIQLQPQTQQQSQQHVSKLPKMKYTQKVVINLELNEMIPKIEDIKAVENVFDISVIDELAKEISSRLLSNPTILEGMIISELEKMMKKNKKPSIRKNTTKKPNADK